MRVKVWLVSWAYGLTPLWGQNPLQNLLDWKTVDRVREKPAKTSSSERIRRASLRLAKISEECQVRVFDKNKDRAMPCTHYLNLTGPRDPRACRDEHYDDSPSSLMRGTCPRSHSQRTTRTRMRTTTTTRTVTTRPPLVDGDSPSKTGWTLSNVWSGTKGFKKTHLSDLLGREGFEGQGHERVLFFRF